MYSAGPTPASTERSSTVWVALGLNQPPRAWRWRRLVSALMKLPASRVVEISPVVESMAVGPGVSGRFWNAAARLETTLPPLQFLRQAKRIERALGRRGVGDRPADIDIVCWRSPWGWRTIESGALTVPHPRAAARCFVLDPLLMLMEPPVQLAAPLAFRRRRIQQ